MASARAWRERTARVFLKKNSHYNLLEVLSPRYEFESGERAEKRRRRRGAEEAGVRHPIFQVRGGWLKEWRPLYGNLLHLKMHFQGLKQKNTTS